MKCALIALSFKLQKAMFETKKRTFLLIEKLTKSIH